MDFQVEFIVELPTIKIVTFKLGWWLYLHNKFNLHLVIVTAATLCFVVYNTFIFINITINDQFLYSHFPFKDDSYVDIRATNFVTRTNHIEVLLWTRTIIGKSLNLIAIFGKMNIDDSKTGNKKN